MKRAIHRTFAILLAAVLLCGVMPLTAHAAMDITDKFTDPAFKAMLQTLLKTEVILDTDVADVAGLRVRDSGIQSLAGLEYFTSLTWLDCSGNQLTSLPALPPNLTELDCKYNQLTSLPALPSGMEILICSHNKLTSLDVTGLPLRWLDCRNNNMASSAVKGFTGVWDGLNYFFYPQNEVIIDVWPPFWDNWPDWLVFILRYLLFGWLWMNWF